MELRGATQISTTRTSVRKLVNETLKSAQTLLKKPEKEQDVYEMEALKDQLDQSSDELKDYDAQIINQMDDETKMQAETDVCVSFQSKITQMLSKLRLAITRLYKTSHDLQDTVITSSSHQKSSHLPTLEVSKFDGDYLEWHTFWGKFNAAIGSNPDLKNIQKLQYLLSYLEGEAKQAVEGYRLIEENYESVVSVLKDTFGDEEIAVCMHFEKLFAMPSGDHTKASLKSIYNECDSHIRSLIALGLEEDMFGKVFVPLILSKLPKHIRLQLHRTNEGKPWRLNDLRNRLKSEVKYREMSERHVSDSTVKPKETCKPEHTKKQAQNMTEPKIPPFSERKNQWPQTRQALISSKQMQNTVSGCAFCGYKNHASEDCGVYRSAAARFEKLRESYACYKCLQQGHTKFNCSSKIRCKYCGGNGHNSALCLSKFGEPYQSRVANSANAVSKEIPRFDSETRKPQEKVCECQANRSTKKITTEVANEKPKEERPVKVQMELAKVELGRDVGQVYVYFDKGSTVSYVSGRLVKRLKLPLTGTETLSIGSFASGRRKTEQYSTTTVHLPAENGEMIPLYAYVLDSITAPVQQYGFDVSKVKVLGQLKMAMPVIADTCEYPIDILIGLDQYRRFVTGETLRLQNGLELVSSKFGYIMSGPFEINDEQSSQVIDSMVTTLQRPAVRVSEPALDLERFWDLEEIGIKESPYLEDDENALTQFNSTVRKSEYDGRYEVTLPYKVKDPDLPSNYGLALGRLKSLFQRFEGQEELLKEYAKILEQQQELEIIEEVQDMKSENKIHYVPHHFVVDKTRDTTKMRMVFDASAKASKSHLSINECLLRGPIILEDLCGLLMRLRLGKVAMSSDVEKAFLQVGLQESERDVTRFLWVKDVTKPVSKDNLKVFRFRRVPFGYISSPFLLSATIKHHLEQDGSKDARDMVQNVYVDNILGVRNSTEEGWKYYETAKRLLADVKMNVRQWSTNDDDLWEKIPEKDRASSRVTKVMGMIWDTEADEISLRPPKKKIPDIISAVSVTKRQLVSMISSFFDPCGFFSPILIRGKMLVQELWKAQVKWDDSIPDSMLQELSFLVQEMICLQEIKVPRWIKVTAKIQLHSFSDASGKAYGAVSYLRCEQGDGSVKVNIIFAKGRLVPIKAVTIPKLELTAMVLAKRISVFVVNQLRLEIDEVHIWTDSMCTLQWIHSTKVRSVYVENRVKEIRAEKTYRTRFVPSEENPADILSRGSSVESLQKNDLWWHGPSFLMHPESKWPKTDKIDFDAVEEDKDKAVPGDPVQQLSKAVNTSKEESGYPFSLPRCSSLPKLLRITGWVKRFVAFCRNKEDRQLRATDVLRAHEMYQAQMFWVKRVQDEAFPDLEAEKLKDLKKNLQLFRDEKGVIRSRGRLENSDLEVPEKFPILLPKNHRFTRLMITDCHERLMHAGVRQTLAQVRLVYWVPQGRQKVQSILHFCRVCRSADGGAFKTPETPPLPPFRVRQSPPFSYVGIDYMGPLIVKIPPTIVIVKEGRKEKKKVITSKKVWISLFTCAVVRAVHLELVDDQASDEFLMALRRCAAMYGKPTMIVCDNAGQFQTTKLLLAELSRQRNVQEYCAKEGISWHFIPELAPWMGAFYERMIQTVKRSLWKTLGKKCLTTSQLQTVLCEVAAVVNTRPLVHVEHEAGEEALTPAHFLAKQGREGLPSFPVDAVGRFNKESTGRGALVKRWNEAQQIMADFWKTWLHEYLAALRERPAVKFNDRKASDITPKPGVVVLIKEEKMPRGKWKLGKITELREGKDGFVRSASVKLANRRVIVRPIRLLYPLEDVDVPYNTIVDHGDDVNPSDSDENDFEGFSEDEIDDAQARLRYPLPDISFSEDNSS